MKIEKLNENQIRCTLTHADLAARHLKLSELAYGTEKAKSLFRDMMQQAAASTKAPEEERPSSNFSIRLFAFETLDGVIRASRLIAPIYSGANTLYKDSGNSMFILALAPSAHTSAEFNKICNMLSEYGSPEKSDSTVLAFLEEHCEIIVSANAVQKLSAL